MRCVLGNVVQFGCWPYINVVFANSAIASTTLIMSCACNTPTFVVYAAAVAVVPSLTKGNQRISYMLNQHVWPTHPKRDWQQIIKVISIS